MLKRFLSIILFVTIISGLFIATPITASAATTGSAYVLSVGTPQGAFDVTFPMSVRFKSGSQAVLKTGDSVIVDGSRYFLSNTNALRDLIPVNSIIKYTINNNIVTHIELPCEYRTEYSVRYNPKLHCFESDGFSTEPGLPVFYRLYGNNFHTPNLDTLHEYDIDYSNNGVVITDMRTISYPVTVKFFDAASYLDYTTQYQEMEVTVEHSELYNPEYKIKAQLCDLNWNVLKSSTFFDDYNMQWFQQLPNKSVSYYLKVWVVDSNGKPASPYYRLKVKTSYRAPKSGILDALRLENSYGENFAQVRINTDNGYVAYDLAKTFYTNGERCQGQRFDEYYYEYLQQILTTGIPVRYYISNGEITHLMFNTNRVIFDLNQGYWSDGFSDDQYVDIVKTGTYPQAPDRPIRDGYVFTGWYASKNAKGVSYIDAAGRAKKMVTSDITLYAGWKKPGSIVWGVDTFSFGNSKQFWGDSYKITDEHYNILTSGLSKKEKRHMDSLRNQDFTGSSFGMSVVMAMLNLGYMTPDFLQKDKNCAAELSYPKNNTNVASVINYYQLSQNLDCVQNELKTQKNTNSNGIAQKLVYFLSEKCSNDEFPVILNYKYKDGRNWKYHTVLAYKLELNLDDMKYRVSIADPNYLCYSSGNSGSFVTETKPRYMIIENDFSNVTYCDKNKGTLNSNSDDFALTSVLYDEELYQSINLQQHLANNNTGTKYNTYSLTEAYSAEDDEIPEDDFQISSAALELSFSEFVLESNGLSSTVTDENCEGDIAIPEGEINAGYSMIEYDFESLDNCTVTPTSDSEIGYTASIVYDGFYMNGFSKDKASFNFNNSGIFEITSENECDKHISFASEYLDYSGDYLAIDGISIETTVPSVCITSLEDGRFKIDSTSSLKNTVLTITDEYGFDVTATISSDTTSFIFYYTYDETGEKIVFEEGYEAEAFKTTSDVVFYTYGGSVIERLVDVANGTYITEPEDPTLAGMLFDGWYYDEEYIYEVDFENDALFYDTILHAKWVEDSEFTHTVTFIDGETVSHIMVENGTALTKEDFPELTERNGYTTSWEEIDLSNITEDMLVNAVADKEILDAADYAYYATVDEISIHANITSSYVNTKSANVYFAIYRNEQLQAVQYANLTPEQFDLLQASCTFDKPLEGDIVRIFVWNEELGIYCKFKEFEISYTTFDD